MTGQILHLIDSGGMYGAEWVVLSLVEQLRKHGWDAVLGCMCDLDGSVPALANHAKSKGLPCTIFRMRRGVSVSGLGAVKRYLRSEGVTILHSHGYKADIYNSLLRRMRVGRISTVHGWSKQDLGIKGRAYRWLDLSALRAMDKVIAVSQAVESDLCDQGIRANRTVVIPNGLPVRETDRESRDEVRAKLGLPHDALSIGCVGRLAKVKGHAYLIEAIDRLKDDFPTIRLFIAGDGPLLPDLRTMIESKGLADRVKLLGFRDDIRALLASFDIFVLPSLSEGLPIALLEAMSLGVPVVASRVGGIPEVIVDDSQGVLVSPGNPSALANAIQMLFVDRARREALGIMGKRRVDSAFSSDAMANSYGGVYSSLSEKMDDHVGSVAMRQKGNTNGGQVS